MIFNKHSKPLKGLVEFGNEINCHKCKYGSTCNVANAHQFYVLSCGMYEPECDQVIITNGDKIRSSTDEEIAEMVAKEIAYLPSTILRWLKQECE